jgi:hypothetical protein
MVMLSGCRFDSCPPAYSSFAAKAAPTEGLNLCERLSKLMSWLQYQDEHNSDGAANGFATTFSLTLCKACIENTLQHDR